MLGTVLDKITSLVGRAFLISAFFPVILFAAASLAPLAAVGGIASILKRWEALRGFQTLAPVVFFLLIVAGAYLLMIVSPVLKRLLEGAYDREWARHVLLRRERRRFARRRRKVQDTADHAEHVRRKHTEWVQVLRQAANEYKAPVETDVTPEEENCELKEAEDTITLLQEGRNALTLKNLEEAAGRVKKLYERCYPLERVESLHRGISKLWEDMEKSAETDYSQALSDIQARYAFSAGLPGVRSTALGNIMAAVWSYAYSRYGIAAEVMWPRLQKVIPADYFRVVEDARISYDFCVGMTFLSLLYACMWLVIIPWGEMHWLWYLIPLIVMFASALLNAAAIEAARAFGAIVQACFDLFRFPLMQELRIQLPADIEAERITWNTINNILIFEDKREKLNYVLGPTEPRKSE